MPIDSLIVSVAVFGMFLIFALALALVDHRTSSWQRSKTSEKQAPVSADAPRKKAA